MEEIFFEGGRYISAGDAALVSGFSRDYVTRLARDGKILGRQVGRQWYVSNESFKTFRVAQEAANKLRRNALVRERQLEHGRQRAVSISAPQTTAPAAPAAGVGERLFEAMQAGTIRAASSAASAAEEIPLASVSVGAELTHKVAAALLAVAMVSVAYTEGGALSSNYLQTQISSSVPIQQALDTAAPAAFSLPVVSASTSAEAQPMSWSDIAADQKFIPPQTSAGISSNAVELAAADAALPPWMPGPSWLHAIASAIEAPLSAAGYVLSLPLRLFSSGALATGGAQTGPEASPSSSAEPSQTVVNTTYNTYNTTNNTTNNSTKNYSTNTYATSSASGGVSESELESKINALADSLQFQSYPNNVPSSGGAANNIALLQNIDNLTGTHLNDITVNGVSGLQPSDIPDLSASYLSVSGGTLSGALVISSSTATSTFADGIDVTGGCVSVNGNCITGGSGAPGGASGSIQFNDGGSLNGVTGFSYATTSEALGLGTSSPSAKFAISETASDTLPRLLSVATLAGGEVFSVATSGVTSASELSTPLIAAPQSFTYTTSSNSTTSTTTFFSSSSATTTVYATNGIFGSGSFGNLEAFSASTTYATTSFLGIGNLNGILQAQNGSVSASSTLSIGFGGTGTSTAPSYGQLLLGNGSGGYDLVSTSSLGIVSGGGSGGVSTSSQNSWSALQIFAGNASTTALSVFDNAYFGSTATSSFNSSGQLSLAGLADSVLYANGSGQVGALGIDGSLLLSGGTLSLNMSNSNTWSALQLFSGGLFASASSTIGNGSQNGGLTINGGATTTGNSLTQGNQTISGGLTVNGSVGGFGILTGSLKSTNGIDVGSNSSASSPNYAFANNTDSGIFEASGGIVGVTVLGSEIGRFTASGLGIGTTSPFAALSVAGNSYIGGNLTATGTVTISPLSNSLLGVNASGQVVATTSIGANLLTGAIGTINGTTLNEGGSITITAASSTLLADNNTFSGNDIFNNAITGNISGNAGTVTNGVYTTTFNGLFDNRLSASSSISGITTLPNLSLPYSQLTSVPNLYPFQVSGNATSTLTQFNGGLTSFASSTIGNGNQSGGLTINGGATTTGNAYVTGTLGIGTQPAAGWSISAGAITLSSQIRVAGGSVTSPAYNFSNQNQGGLFAPSSQAVAFALNGLEAGRFTSTGFSSGNFGLGIGTTSPGARLAISGASLGTSALFNVSSSTASATTTVFSIDQNGNTTIGNNGSVLTVNGATTTAANGINLATGCFAVGGNCLTLGSFSGTLSIGNGGTNAISFTSGQLLSYNGTSFVSTSTIGNNQLQNSSITVNGSGIALGGSITITAASSTLLADNNTFSGNETFNNIITGNISGNAGTVTNGVYTTNFGTLFDNRLSASSSISGITTLPNLLLPYSQLTSVPNLYPFQVSGNATSTLTQFNGGLTAYASSTIGNGSQNGGLTITGGATTTGNALVSGTLNVNGRTTLGNASTTVFSVSGNSYLGTGQASTFAINSILSCGGSEALQTDGSGNVSCGTIASGGASAGGGWIASGGSVNGSITESTSTYLVAVGATSTPYAKFAVISGNAATTTLALVPASSQTADILDIYNTSGALGSVFTAAGDLGLGTTSPGSILSVQGVGNFVASATSTLYNGLNLTSGCFSVNGICVGSSSASSTLLADNNTFSGTDIFNNAIGGSITGNADTATTLQTARTINGVSFDGSADIAINAASSTLLANNNTFSGTNIFSNGLTVNSGLTLGTALTVGNGGTGINSTPSYGNILVGNGTNYTLTATSSLGLPTFANIASAYPFQVIGNATSTLTQFNGGLTAFASSTIGNGGANGLTVNGNATTTGNFIEQGLTSLNAATSTNFAITSLANSLLGVNANGTVVATTSIGTNLLTGNLATINGTTIGAGSTNTITAASSTLLADNNTFSGNDIFNNTITGSISGNAGTVTNGVYTTTFGTLFDNRLSASSSISGITTLPNLSLPYSQLTSVPNLYPFQASGNATSTLTQFNGGLTAFASSTIGNGNQNGGLTINGGATTTGNLLVQGNAMLVAATSTNFAITNLANSLLGVNGSGTVVATSSIGTNLLTGALGTINGTTLNEGGSITISAASSTLLSNNNTWTGLNTFANASSTLATLGTTWFNGLNNALLSTNGSGQLVATTSVGVNYLSGVLPVGNGGTGQSSLSSSQLLYGAGTSGVQSVATSSLAVDSTLTAASGSFGYQVGGSNVTFGLNLASANSWTGLQTFQNASSTNLSIFGTAYFGGTATSTFNSAGQLTLGALGTFGGGFVSQASSTVAGAFTTTGTATLGSVVNNGLGANQFVYTNGSKQEVSAASSSLDLPNAALQNSTIKVNGTTLTLGDTGDTITAASSTLLANNNTFSGNDIFSNTLALTDGFVSQASSTIAGPFTATGGLTVGNATSSFANGITLTSGCVYYNGSCIGANSGTVNSGLQGQFAFYNTNGTTISATSTLFVTQAGNIGIGTTTPGIISGANQYLTLASAGGSSDSRAALEIAGNTNSVNGIIGRISFYNQAAQDELARIGVQGSGDVGQGILSFWTGNDGTLSEAALFDQYGDFGIGTTTPGSILSVQDVGNFVANATSTLYDGLNLTSGCFSVNGTCVGTTAASSTLLSDNNTFSGTNSFTGNTTFASATSTNFAITDLSNSLLAANGSGSVVATTSIGTNLLTGNLATINGTTVAENGTYTITAASSTLLANNNTWTGLQSFANASSTLTTLGTTWFSGLNNAILSTNANGQVVATTSIGVNYLTGTLGVGNGGTGINSTPSYGQLLLGNGTNYTLTATSSLGLPTFANLASAYPFQVSGNATSTLTQFNGGLTSYASSTIGNGSQNGGLTITGGATTTGNAYFAGNVGIGTPAAIDLLQVSGLATPTEASSTSSGLSDPLSVYVSGRYAYVTSGGSLVVFDVSNPASPAEVGSSASVMSLPSSVYVSGRYAYVTDISNGQGLYMFDISNPASPVEVSFTSNGLSNATSVYVSGRYAYVTSGGTNTLVVFDISNPASPVKVGSASISSPESVYVSGSYAYVASGSTLAVFDVSNPASPTKVGSVSGSSITAESVYVSGRYAYMVGKNFLSTHVLEIFDVSNPASPAEVGSSSSGLNSPYSVYVSGRYAYVADAADGLVVFDVSNPASPVEAGSATSGLNTARSVYVSGRYAYIASELNNSLVTFNIGGEYTQSLEAGTLQAGSLELDNNLQALDGAFSGSLSVSKSLSVIGSASVLSASSTLSTTANIFNIATASSTSSIFSVLGNGDIGIGTSTPGSILSVQGVGNFVASATSTLYNSLAIAGNLNLNNLASAVLAVNSTGQVVATTSIGTNLLTGTLGVGNGGTGINSTPSYGNILVGNGTNYTLTATSSLGLPTFANLTASIGAAYPFQLTGNATSTLTQFNGGLTAYASSTIGNGNQNGGLTINGGATTTGIAYFTGNVGIGTSTPSSQLALQSNSPFITIDNQFTSEAYQIQGPTLTTSRLNFDYTPDYSTSGFTNTVLSLSGDSSDASEVDIGTTSNIHSNGSRLFVYGGGHGANVDVMGDPTITDGDEAFLEAEGSDYGTELTGAQSSVALRYYGPTFSLSPTSALGYTAKDLGELDFGGATTSIITTGNNSIGANNPLIFGTGYTQRMVLDGSGNLGIGTTSPWAQLSVATPNGASGSQTELFAIASSSLSGTATSTLLSFDSAGQLAIGPNVSPVSAAAQLSVLAGTTTVTRVSQTTLADNAGDAVAIQGSYAYIAVGGSNTNSLNIYDVSNPSSPSLIGQANTLAFDGEAIAVQGKYAYLAIGGLTTNGLEIFDVSNPVKPWMVSTLNLTNGGQTVDGIYVQGRYAYVTDVATNGTNGFQIFDVSDPSAPALVSNSTLANGADAGNGGASISVQGSYAYIAEGGGTTNGLEIFNVANPAAPYRVSQSALANGSGQPDSIYVQGRYAYVAEGSGTTHAFEIFDISNPASPTRVSQSNLAQGNSNGGGDTIVVQGQYAYVAEGSGTNDAFQVFNVSNPASPSLISQSNLANGANGVSSDGLAVSGRYAYLAEGEGTTNAFEIFDLGGAYIQQLEAGALEAGTLSLRNNLTAVDGQFSGGLGVGGSLQVTGSASILAATSTIGTTANIFSIATASSTNSIVSVLGNGNVGIGTSTPGSIFSVQGVGNFVASATSTLYNSLAIGGNLNLNNISNSLLSTNGTGQVVATTSVGTNYITGVLGTINSTSFSRGGSITVTAASSSLLSDNDTFSGTDIFTKALSLTGTTGTTTIASGQGFTIGSSKFVVQQGSGNVGIGTSSPYAEFTVEGSSASADIVAGSWGSSATYGMLSLNGQTGTGANFYSSTGDNNLYINRPTGGGIDFRMSNADQMDLLSSGNLGIASTTPWARLSVDTSSLGAGVPEFAVGSSTRSDLVVTQAGDVGIGTSSPQQLLDIKSGSTEAYFGPVCSGTGNPTYFGIAVGENGLSNCSSYTLLSNGADSWLNAPSGGSDFLSVNNTNVLTAASGNISVIGDITSSGSVAGFETLDRGGTGGQSYFYRNGNITYLYDNSGGNTLGYNTTGNVGVETLAAGTSNSLCYSTSGVSGMDTLSTCSSDERLKQNITALPATTTLAQLMELDPVSFNWNPQFASSTQEQFGLIAQQVQQVWPNLISTTSPTSLTPDGTLSLNFNGLYGPIISSIQDINDVFSATNATTSVPSILSMYQGTSTPLTIDQFGDIGIGTSTATTTTNLQLCLNGSCITSFPYSFSATSSTSTAPAMTLSQDFLKAIESALTTWFASTTNGVQSFFASVIHANEVDTTKLCVSDSTGAQTCVTKAQLDALLASVAAGSANPPQAGAGGTSSGGGTSSTTAAILQVNGDDPVTVQVGATYEDLGATITGPVQDLNLGVSASVDGATSTAIADVSIDTSVPGTHTILYSATDQNGVTGSATRTVVVVAADAGDSNATSTDQTGGSDATSADASSTSSSDDSGSTTNVQSATSSDATSTTP